MTRSLSCVRCEQQLPAGAGYHEDVGGGSHRGVRAPTSPVDGSRTTDRHRQFVYCDRADAFSVRSDVVPLFRRARPVRPGLSTLIIFDFFPVRPTHASRADIVFSRRTVFALLLPAAHRCAVIEKNRLPVVERDQLQTTARIRSLDRSNNSRRVVLFARLVLSPCFASAENILNKNIIIILLALIVSMCNT